MFRCPTRVDGAAAVGEGLGRRGAYVSVVPDSASVTWPPQVAEPRVMEMWVRTRRRRGGAISTVRSPCGSATRSAEC